MKTPYFSRDSRYKTPFGAVAAGEQITFRLFLPLDCSGAELLFCRDGQPEQVRPFCRTHQQEPDGFWWECGLTLNEPGLHYYRFSFDTPFGHNILTCGMGGAAIMNPAGASYQLTVYDPAFTTPHWFKGGVMYQIFPDRFACSGTPKRGVPDDRYLYRSFEGTPCYEYDPEKLLRLNNDYWGGDLKGIEQKLPYLKEMGVTVLYLNPIFEAHSNHRYNTADYRRIDPMLGDEKDFVSLCRAAHKLDIRIILDGVFSHTGSDSVYFNSQQRYPMDGAANRPDSPYRSWYTFTDYPAKYHSWWGFTTLPEVNETDPGYLEFITGEQGVAAHWLSLGADGWRLDVADELPDGFLERFRQRVKKTDENALILGEVWEDATNKISYGNRRSYLLGKQLDSVMNYPFMNGVLSFVRNGDGEALMEGVMGLVENYPPPALHTLMNHLGTHDTARLITTLVGENDRGRDRRWQAAQSLTPAQYALGEQLVKLAVVLQYTLPGVPCVYYGDELGMEGYRDPFNRAPMAKTAPLPHLRDFYVTMGRLRGELPVLAAGSLIPYVQNQHLVSYLRQDGKQTLLVAVNRGEEPQTLPLPCHPQQVLMGEVKEGFCELKGRDAALILLK